jgi:hypothetical protein
VSFDRVAVGIEDEAALGHGGVKLGKDGEVPIERAVRRSGATSAQQFGAVQRLSPGLFFSRKCATVKLAEAGS